VSGLTYLIIYRSAKQCNFSPSVSNRSGELFIGQEYNLSLSEAAKSSEGIRRSARHGAFICYFSRLRPRWALVLSWWRWWCGVGSISINITNVRRSVIITAISHKQLQLSIMVISLTACIIYTENGVSSVVVVVVAISNRNIMHVDLLVIPF